MMTIGHSTLRIEAFLRALKDNGVETMVDVRKFPGSRRNPQFSREALFRSLEGVGIRGMWREALGNVRLVGNTDISTRFHQMSGSPVIRQ